MIPIILPATGPNQAPILSAVRVGTSDTPAEFIVIVDCQEGTPIEPYATLHLYAWPGQVKFRAGVYNLTWVQAKCSLAERAGLIPHRDIEVAVIAREPHQTDLDRVFVDGSPVDDASRTMVRTEVFYLDPDDEDIHELRDGLHRAASLTPAAQAQVTQVLQEFAHAHGIEAGDD
jgi:hypothetical protein